MPVTSPILDILLLDTHNLTTLAVADNSQYPVGFTIVNPSLSIVPPSFPVKTVVFANSNLNVFTTNDVGITCPSGPDCTICNLPDGYWQLTYTISPALTYTVTKSFMRTDLLQQKLAEVFLSLDLDKCDETVSRQDMLKVDQIQYYIQTSIAAGNKCNEKLAIDLYNIAERMLDEFLNHKCYGSNLRGMRN